MSTNTEHQIKHDGASVDIEQQEPGEFTEKPWTPDFPEGGLKGWLVVIGAMVTTGCSFGYVSAFGYV